MLVNVPGHADAPPSGCGSVAGPPRDRPAGRRPALADAVSVCLLSLVHERERDLRAGRGDADAALGRDRQADLDLAQVHAAGRSIPDAPKQLVQLALHPLEPRPHRFEVGNRLRAVEEPRFEDGSDGVGARLGILRLGPWNDERQPAGSRRLTHGSSFDATAMEARFWTFSTVPTALPRRRGAAGAGRVPRHRSPGRRRRRPSRARCPSATRSRR